MWVEDLLLEVTATKKGVHSNLLRLVPIWDIHFIQENSWKFHHWQAWALNNFIHDFSATTAAFISMMCFIPKQYKAQQIHSGFKISFIPTGWQWQWCSNPHM